MHTTPVHGPGGGAGGGAHEPPLPSQLHEHGGQLWPATQVGQAQAQPPPPPPEEPPCWHTPERQVCPGLHGMPSAYQLQELAVSAPQLASSVWDEQGSVGALPASSAPPPPPPQSQGGQAWPGAQSGQTQLVAEPPEEPPPVEPPPLATPPAATQSQEQGGHDAPGSHAGHAQAQVPSSTQPASSVPGSHSQAQGGHDWPGIHAGHAQLQVPPPLPPPEQSHSIGGQAVPAGQKSGLTQAQAPSPVARAWQ